MFSSIFGFAPPRPPLATSQRVWIELCLRRTLETVGRGQVAKATMVRELGELGLDTSTADGLLNTAAAQLTERLWIGEQPPEVTIVDHESFGYPSSYQDATDQSPPRICLSTDTIADPLRAVMELAYQLSHHYWLTQPVVTDSDLDPRNTHLLPICGGLGILASDASLYDKQWSSGGWSGWSMSRSGYYNAEEIGYALALLARARNESEPSWVNRLRLDSQVAFRNATGYFARLDRSGGQLLFDGGRIPCSTSNMTDLAHWLCGDDPAFAMAAGHVLLTRHDLPPLVVQAALAASASKDREVVPIAARLLGAARVGEPAIEQRLVALIRHPCHAIALAALQSAAQLNLPIEPLAPRIAKLLNSKSIDVIALLELVGRQGPSLEALTAPLCKLLPQAVRTSDVEWFHAMVDCLAKVSRDPVGQLKSRVKSADVLQNALQRIDAVTASE